MSKLTAKGEIFHTAENDVFHKATEKDKKIKKTISDIKKECLFLKVLGSYPSAE